MTRDVAHAYPMRPVPGTPHMYGENLVLHGYPYPMSLLARLGHPDTRQPEVGTLCRRLFEYLFTQVSSIELENDVLSVPTRMTAHHPEQAYHGVIVRKHQRVVVVDVARAGIVPAQIFYENFNVLLDPDGVRQDHLFMSRKVNSEGQVIGAAVPAAKIGGGLEGARLFIPDPMGATGSSIAQLLEHYHSLGAGEPDRIICVHLIVTPEYVQRVHQLRPDIRIHAIRLDRGFSSAQALGSPPGTHPESEKGLNEHQYIVPGAGGLGEVLNNSWV